MPDHVAVPEDTAAKLIREWRNHANMSRRRFMEVERDEPLQLCDWLEAVHSLMRADDIDFAALLSERDVLLAERQQLAEALERIAAHPHGGILVNIARSALAAVERPE